MVVRQGLVEIKMEKLSELKRGKETAPRSDNHSPPESGPVMANKADFLSVKANVPRSVVVDADDVFLAIGLAQVLALLVPSTQVLRLTCSTAARNTSATKKGHRHHHVSEVVTSVSSLSLHDESFRCNITTHFSHDNHNH